MLRIPVHLLEQLNIVHACVIKAQPIIRAVTCMYIIDVLEISVYS